LLKRRTVPPPPNANVENSEPTAHDHVADHDQVERLLGELQGPEANVVRLFYLEGKSYHEISRQTGVAENTIGPMLSRARARMKMVGA
jgi:RNA polymerase sigma-70 factor (ECF subfamily)